MKLIAAAIAIFGFASMAQAQTAPVYDSEVFAAAAKIQPKVIAWRRDIHQHPELSGHETRTAKFVADQLKRLGFDVRTKIGGEGVVGVLKGAKPGKVVALRADMDGLPVSEQTGLPFASKATGKWQGQTVPVMHACGHDAHIAMLLGAAEILSSMRASLPGTLVVIFQPAEEGREDGGSGADLMLKANALTNPKPDAVFGVHVFPGETGAFSWRSGAYMASSDRWSLKVTGKQTHGAMPWKGIDAASVAADIVQSFNQIAARQLDVGHTPTILTVGEIHLGTRYNIIPGEFTMTGTLRTFDPAGRTQTLAAIEKTMQAMNAKYGVTAVFETTRDPIPVTWNDPALSTRMTPTLARASGGKADGAADYYMAAEDFSYYATIAPTLFVHLGIGDSPGANHSPVFTIDEKALEAGVRGHVLFALDFLNGS